MIQVSSVTPTIFIDSKMVEPVIYDHRIGHCVPYSHWLQWSASQNLKSAPWRPYAHVV